jgi:cephalosporin-C deacetylase-like acetyl esterase
MNFISSLILVVHLFSVSTSPWTNLQPDKTAQNFPNNYYFPFIFATEPPIIPDAPPIQSDDWGGLPFQEILIPSSLDVKEKQEARFYFPPDQTYARPLIVGLHSWSTRYDTYFVAPYLQWAIANRWVFISPNFRGANGGGNNPADTTGSDKVVQDIVDAVEWAKAHANVDTKRIYLVGASGGGHAALLMAGRHPEIWAGVSAWASITDLPAWYAESLNIQTEHRYEDDLVAACGGDPSKEPPAEIECLKRSPISYLNNTITVPLDINAGIFDGHLIGSTWYAVPIRHSLKAFNRVAAADHQLTDNQIDFMVKNMEIPDSLQGMYPDPLYGDKAPLFRRQSGNARITVFNGYHEIVYWAALAWLSVQHKP